jgi:hypothetical protein
MDDLLKRLVELESDIEYQMPPSHGQPEFSYLPGRLPVLLSAPHGAAHRRKSYEYKDEDEYTAGLVRLLAELTGAHALYARNRSTSDPNVHPDTPYKQKMREITSQASIRFVLDLHGASDPKYTFGIALGTIGGKSCPVQRPLILSMLAKHGFSSDASGRDNLDVDKTFKGAGAAKRETITRYASQVLHVPAAQFELFADVRIVQRRPNASKREPFQGDPQRIRRVIETFTEMVEVLSIT